MLRANLTASPNASMFLEINVCPMFLRFGICTLGTTCDIGSLQFDRRHAHSIHKGDNDVGKVDGGSRHFDFLEINVCPHWLLRLAPQIGNVPHLLGSSCAVTHSSSNCPEFGWPSHSSSTRPEFNTGLRAHWITRVQDYARAGL